MTSKVTRTSSGVIRLSHCHPKTILPAPNTWTMWHVISGQRMPRFLNRWHCFLRETFLRRTACHELHRNTGSLSVLAKRSKSAAFRLKAQTVTPSICQAVRIVRMSSSKNPDRVLSLRLEIWLQPPSQFANITIPINSVFAKKLLF